MTEPTTPTGRRLVEGYELDDPGPLSSTRTGYVRFDDILAIEAEARQQVRERLREAIEPVVESIKALTSRDAVYLAADDISALLSDPEPDR